MRLHGLVVWLVVLVDVVRVHWLDLLVIVMLRIGRRNSPPPSAATAHPRSGSHLTSSSGDGCRHGLPSRQMTTVHPAGLGVVHLQWLSTTETATACSSRSPLKPVRDWASVAVAMGNVVRKRESVLQSFASLAPRLGRS
jgi:hypothetical protein